MAQEFKGTPGVWCITYEGDGYFEINDFTIEVRAFRHVGEEEARANAQLIMHAPEMLELLTALADRKELPWEDRRWIYSLLDRIKTI